MSKTADFVTMNGERYYSTEFLCKKYNCSDTTLHTKRNTYSIPWMKIGKHCYIQDSDKFLVLPKSIPDNSSHTQLRSHAAISQMAVKMEDDIREIRNGIQTILSSLGLPVLEDMPNHGSPDNQFEKE